MEAHSAEKLTLSICTAILEHLFFVKSFEVLFLILFAIRGETVFLAFFVYFAILDLLLLFHAKGCRAYHHHRVGMPRTRPC